MDILSGLKKQLDRLRLQEARIGRNLEGVRESIYAVEKAYEAAEAKQGKKP